MLGKKKILGVLLFVTSISAIAQNELLIIGRTTGELVLEKNKKIRIFGFSNSLSGQVNLPATTVEMMEGDSLTIDFWNISQGNPASMFFEGLEFNQISKEYKILTKNQPIDHMEHGFYRLYAKKKGTYLYYSPENYPFNLQAGMFGIIIVKEKNENLLTEEDNKVVWCSHEIDPNWHTDEIMDVEHTDLNKPLELLKFQPEYYLINGILAHKIGGLWSSKVEKKSIVLHLVNAGLFDHVIEFPKQMNPNIIFGNVSNLIHSSLTTSVVLHSKDTMEIELSLMHLNKKESIVYNYVNPENDKTWNKVKIPIFY